MFIVLRGTTFICTLTLFWFCFETAFWGERKHFVSARWMNPFYCTLILKDSIYIWKKSNGSIVVYVSLTVCGVNDSSSYKHDWLWRLWSHLGQNLDKFVLITKNSVKFLSSVDLAKCDLLVSTRTKTCPWRQIFKGAVVLPRSTTSDISNICLKCDPNRSLCLILKTIN